MGKSFKDSLKALEADIQHANTLALDYPREKDGARLQMRLSYSSVAHLFLFLVQWTDCHLAGVLAVIFPSLLQLQKGITDLEDRKQKDVCNVRYKRKDESERGKLSEIDKEREEECGICMEVNSKFVLPNCSHSMCLKCYRDWRGRSQSCPFCRDSLKRVNSGDLWVYTEKSEVIDLATILREDRKRLFMYIDKLPLVVPDPVYIPYDSHVRSGDEALSLNKGQYASET
ncbi:RING finger protein 141 [Morus notabilis]|uniref:RING finger protein 141 n=1 Tax=Morus notabilis TaxID=981085 RepID=W9RZZ1_9ROSA|nr:RING finger protein 141 [Morus notabilis]